MQQSDAQLIEAAVGPETVEAMQRFTIAARAFANAAPSFRPLLDDALRECRAAGVDLADALPGSVLGEAWDAFAAAHNASQDAHAAL